MGRVTTPNRNASLVPEDNFDQTEKARRAVDRQNILTSQSDSVYCNSCHRDMFLLTILLSLGMAAKPSNRPVEKKIEHLKKAAPAMIKLYFVDAIPSSSNPAHGNGTIKKLERRERVGARLTAKLTSLADVVQEALDSGCINVEPRGNLERFVQG